MGLALKFFTPCLLGYTQAFVEIPRKILRLRDLFGPETEHGRLVDHRISSYQPKGYVARHAHKVQEQIYHVLDGEGIMELSGERHVVRRHDVIFIPPGIEHSIINTGLEDLVFLVITVPPTDG